MSAKKANDEDGVIEKLDKVADTLETASSQLSGVVTQQQLDLARERIITLEADLEKVKEGYEVLAERIAVHAKEAEASYESLKRVLDNLERDFAGLRALVLTSFALATISLMGLVVFAVST